MHYMRTSRMKIQALLPDRRRRQDVRPEGRVETPAYFIGTGRSGLHHAALHLDDGLGPGITERHGDVATYRDLVRCAADSMKVEAAGAQPQR
jgi:hypothetical protein